MILMGSQRGNAAQLARHLLNDRDNEHVELHEVRGFASESLTEALKEAEMVAKGTRCNQFLFSLSMNPPEHENVPIEIFEASVEIVEQKLGLMDQPRAVIFHEKEGRRHAHVIWSRIDANSMTAKHLPYFKNQLMNVSRELYLENNWDMPKGLIDREMRNPLNMTRAEWEQASRTKQDPRMVKAAIKSCWDTSDSLPSLNHALEERGYFLARGDRRGFVAVDIRGEVFSIGRAAGVKASELKDRVGNPSDLPSVAEVKTKIADRMTSQLSRYLVEIETSYKTLPPRLEMRCQQMKDKHHTQRQALEQKQQKRWDKEAKGRAIRMPTGLKALWGRLIGEFNQMKLKNELDAWECLSRDRKEKDELIARQLCYRRLMQSSIVQHRNQRSLQLQKISVEIAEYVRLGRGEVPSIERLNETDLERINTATRQQLNTGPEFDIS